MSSIMDLTRIANDRVHSISVVNHTTETPDVVNQYTTWVKNGNYDEEMVNGLGYTVPDEISMWISSYIPRDKGWILDAGAGTGLIGQTLHALGGRYMSP